MNSKVRQIISTALDVMRDEIEANSSEFNYELFKDNVQAINKAIEFQKLASESYSEDITGIDEARAYILTWDKDKYGLDITPMLVGIEYFDEFKDFTETDIEQIHYLAEGDSYVTDGKITVTRVNKNGI